MHNDTRTNKAINDSAMWRPVHAREAYFSRAPVFAEDKLIARAKNCRTKMRCWKNCRATPGTRTTHHTTPCHRHAIRIFHNPMVCGVCSQQRHKALPSSRFARLCVTLCKFCSKKRTKNTISAPAIYIWSHRYFVKAPSKKCRMLKGGD